MDNSINAKNKVDLRKFGLAGSETEDGVPEVETIGLGSTGYQPAYHNELFAGEEVRYILDFFYPKILKF